MMSNTLKSILEEFGGFEKVMNGVDSLSRYNTLDACNRWLISNGIRSNLMKSIIAENDKHPSVKLSGIHATDLKRWIEYQFVGDMSWSNYGKLWELDHVIPIRCVDVSIPTGRRIACNAINLKPLLKIANRRKKKLSWNVEDFVEQEIKWQTFNNGILNKKYYLVRVQLDDHWIYQAIL